MKRLRTIQSDLRGFTITEMMIATMVFSVILLVISMGIVSFSNRYYKASNQSTTQNTARSIIDSISQAIQFGTANVFPSGVNNYFCAGGNLFMFDTTGAMYTGLAGQRGVYMVPMDGIAMAGSLCHNQSLLSGQQLLGERMRITQLSVVQIPAVSNMYSISISIAYGENDLLCAPSTHPSSCDSTAVTLTDAQLRASPDVTCKGRTGSQFCATSRLTTTVQKRV